MPDVTSENEMVLTGIGASPGICIGKAYMVDREGVDIVKKYIINENNLKKEIKRFKAAVRNSKDELLAIISKTPEELQQHNYILETHIVLLKDKMLYGQTLETIKGEGVNAEWALKKVVTKVKAMFRSMTDPYLRERVSDILQVSDRIMRNLVGAEQVNIGEIHKRVILVAHDLSPADASQIQLERIKGFITDRGGKASHTGIIARTLEIPAVLGLDNATRVIQNEDVIIVDGTAGIVIIHPTEQTLFEYTERLERYEDYIVAIKRGSHLPSETKDGFHLKVLGNIELPEEVVSVIDYGGDGIGLYRTEFQYLSRRDFPSEFELYDKYRDVVEVMGDKPVTIRTLDINGDKAVSYTRVHDELNPVLGLRAIRYCLKKPDVFRTQLRAILRAAAHGSVRVLFPMISTCSEIVEAKKMLDAAAESLDKEGIVFNRDVAVGIMVEVPSAVIMADTMARYVDFFSIGTNDLIQFSLAIDRGNQEVAHLYQPLHPAIIRMVRSVADAARNNGIKAFMCGEMAGSPVNVPILLGLGLDELSMNPQSMPAVKGMIRSLTLDEARVFVGDVLKKTMTRDIIAMVEDTYGDLISDMMYTNNQTPEA
jgi:phosphoenolpyruvate-protein phosphotransferase (PTS system enzyme I)